MKVFIDEVGNLLETSEVVFCDIDTPGPAQFIGYVTKKSFESTNCIDNWVRAFVRRGKPVEYETICGMEIVKGTHIHRRT